VAPAASGYHLQDRVSLSGFLPPTCKPDSSTVVQVRSRQNVLPTPQHHGDSSTDLIQSSALLSLATDYTALHSERRGSAPETVPGAALQSKVNYNLLRGRRHRRIISHHVQCLLCTRARSPYCILTHCDMSPNKIPVRLKMHTFSLGQFIIRRSTILKGKMTLNPQTVLLPTLIDVRINRCAPPFVCLNSSSLPDIWLSLSLYMYSTCCLPLNPFAFPSDPSPTIP
jgi:hypothetical protein